jgi:glycerate kinase
MAELIKVEAKMKDVEVVITGEGSLDRQTLEGKAPAGVAKMARKLGKPVYAMVGRADKDQAVQKLFDGVYALSKRGVSERASIEHAAELLRERSRELAGTIKKRRTSNTEHRTSKIE